MASSLFPSSEDKSPKEIFELQSKKQIPTEFNEE
jgi:hypothetical protein